MTTGHNPRNTHPGCNASYLLKKKKFEKKKERKKRKLKRQLHIFYSGYFRHLHKVPQTLFAQYFKLSTRIRLKVIFPVS